MLSIAGIAGAAPRVSIDPSLRLVANLWVDGNGGSCGRTLDPGRYHDRAACGSINAAWNACHAGDTIAVRPGLYGAQTITGDKPAPGCSVRDANADPLEDTSANGSTGDVTIGALVTKAAFFALDNDTIDVGESKLAGWQDQASNVRLSRVRLHGPFVTVDISGVTNVSWVGSELGLAGQTGRPRVCGQDAEPVQAATA